MKKIAVLIVALAACLAAGAQECSTTWPYLYPEFREGTIYMKGGTKIRQQVNVHILRSSLHYLDKGVVKEAFAGDVLVINIGEDRYMVVDGSIMKVVASEERGFVAALSLGDFDKLRESGGAYGTSTTNSATQKYTSLDIAGVNQNHMEMWESRHNGDSVDLVTTYYLVTPSLTCKATRKAFEEAIGSERKAAFKAWSKTNKIKWNNPESILALIDFLNAE